MSDRIAIRIHGGGQIIVPASAAYLSTYVLLEQEDWFEKEIEFVRRLISPGMRAIDVGANYGCYSVALGRALGTSGALWLYEPARATFQYLRRTLEANRLQRVFAHRLALSDHEGSAVLTTSDNSELNSLAPGAGTATESVELTTLDRQRATHAIAGVDFVKLDAEGEEVRILAGGREFFRAEDPLVMFEVKHGDSVNVELPAAFRALGYGLYRLVGPATLLVPVTPEQPLDGYELNLFACKPGRAARLEAAGMLLGRGTAAVSPAPGSGLDFWRAQQFASAFGAAAGTRDPDYARALDHYALWRDMGAPAATRFAALERALEGLLALVARAASFARLYTLARVAHEAGARGIAVQVLDRIFQFAAVNEVALDEACWPALARYDRADVAGDTGAWLTASAAEAHVRAHGFSGYFTGPTALPLLDWLHASRFASAPMERRLQLQSIFAGRRAHVDAAALLQVEGPDHLNPELWTAGSRIDLLRAA
jgi:FkbM family methyltransferase